MLLLLGPLALLPAGCAQMPFPSLPLDRGAKDSAADAEATPPEAAAETAAEPLPEPQEEAKPGQLYDWSGDGRSVTRIVIDTNEQKARFYDGKEQIGWTTIASGVSSHPTPRGEFTILEKVAKKRSNLYGKIVNRQGKVIRSSADGKDPVPAGARFVGASMPHFMRLTYDGIGMHAGPIPNPGHPASHGCIRMPKSFAATVFKHVEHGTPVTVIGKGPDYGNYAERVARQQAEERARRAAAAAAASEKSALDSLDAEVAAIKDDGSGASAKTGRESGQSGGTTGSRRRQAAATQPQSDAKPNRAQARAAKPDTATAQQAQPAQGPSKPAPSAQSTPAAPANPSKAPADTDKKGQPAEPDTRAQAPDPSPAEPLPQAPPPAPAPPGASPPVYPMPGAPTPYPIQPYPTPPYHDYAPPVHSAHRLLGPARPRAEV